jgi:putative ABC transport system substrate-binding protein
MRRRDFIVALGSAAAWPVAVRAQQPAVPVIGFLHTRAPEGYLPYLSAFHKALGDAGFVEGRTLAVEYRWANGQFGTQRLGYFRGDAHDSGQTAPLGL